MPRKRLTELLQEEAQKFTPSPDETAIEVTAEKVLDTEETAETEISTSEETTVKTPLETTAKRANPTKAELEITMKNLQESLEKSQNQETALKQEITELKTALSEQKALSEKLGKELYETKKTALKLAESNSQLIEENNEFKKQTVTESVKEPVKETVKQPAKEITKSLSVNPRKSYKPPEIIVEKSKPDTKKDDFSNNTWLYD
ncbi:hypothetical protein [Sphaerospermopsis sp. LEGE 08334]|jgi:hypothetical protein|uniref:hypothetical protein n=1 Tax=Sphaerospermopsis sp. LEGE 08334 TaxID=1828651 RepID=UPI00187FF7B3|nr:hypothetical protein [Sphaerospermopsis sp. LEGE 08334]MBE9055158.1 hypothetical protein [Sphaerospermopsis sp. LEGE 08334]